ncbi:MAG: thiamine phosphate synthase [bacterium]|nr:thiamine phosphate synthase [bacterium]
MKLLVLSQPEWIDGESEILSHLLSLPGFELLLRKPEASEAQQSALIEALDPKHYPRLWLRGAPILTLEYGLAGHHFPQNQRPQAVCWRRRLRKAGCRLSTGVHDPRELVQLEGYDRALFSPVFDSISKPGHRPNYKPAELEAGLRKLPFEVFGMGGVRADKLGQLKSKGFKGAAILGALWEATDAFEALKQIIKQAQTP